MAKKKGKKKPTQFKKSVREILRDEVQKQVKKEEE